MHFEDYLRKKLNEEDGSFQPNPSYQAPQKPTEPTSPPEQASSPISVNFSTKPKWKASKAQILKYWKTLGGEQPIPMKPIKYDHKGSTYGEDGIRITGSPNFIQAVLGKLRELLRYEGPETKLGVVYRQTFSKKREAMGLSPISFVFYIQSKERGKKRKFK